MVRAKVWFRCAALHDPVTPVVVRPAVLGWDAKERNVDLTIERAFSGEELVGRMKGWVTVDVRRVLDAVRPHGVFKLLDERDLVLETESEAAFEALNLAFAERFGDQLHLERL